MELEDCAKAWSAASAVHFESFRSALRRTLFSLQEVSSDPENESIAHDVLQLVALLHAVHTIANDGFCAASLNDAVVCAALLNDQRSNLMHYKDSMMALAPRLSHAVSGSFRRHVLTALESAEEDATTLQSYYSHQNVRNTKRVLLMASAPYVSSAPEQTMEVFASIISSCNIGIVTAVEFREGEGTMSVTTAASNVRTMILTHYLTNVGAIGRVFSEFDVKELPDAMEWIGRDNIGFSAMYNLLRSNPMMILMSGLVEN